MNRRRKKNLSLSNTQKISNSIKDPKFYYKCYVPLVNCDFSKYISEKFEVEGKRVQTMVPYRNQLNREKLEEPSMNLNRHINSNTKARGVTQTNKSCKSNAANFHSIPPQRRGVNFVDESKENYIESPQVDEQKILRERKKVDYREKRSFGTPNISLKRTQGNQYIPIYKRDNSNSPKSRKRKCGLYDFVPESDDDKDSDVSYILPTKKKKIDNHFKTNKTQYKRDKNFTGAIVKYDAKINGIMNKLSSKIKSKMHDKIYNSENHDEITKQKKHIRYHKEPIVESVFNSTMLPVTRKIVPPDESIVSREYDGKEHSKTNILDYKSKKSLPASENSSFNTEIDSYSNPCSPSSFRNTNIRSFDEEVENLFGFCDGIQDDKERRTGGKTVCGIQVIQNIILNHPNPLNPYMSTPNRPKERKSWRFDANILNRNPHFISIKKNSLPSLNQEPVLDHTFDERINEVNHTILIPSAKKTPRQQSILNFLESDREHPVNCTYSQSLYDIDEFSPIKKDKDTEKENLPHKRIINNSSKGNAKRNILGEICDINKKNGPSPKNNEELIKSISSSSSDEKSEKQSFGFSLDAKENEQVHERQAKPFRVEFTYKNSKKNDIFLEKMAQPVRDSEVRRLIEDDPGFDDVVNQDGLDCGDMGLFEDIQESPKHVRTKPHTKKKTEGNNKNKQAEPKLSKEAQKWIKEFNQMCDEVDHEQLEIE